MKKTHPIASMLFAGVVGISALIAGDARAAGAGQPIPAAQSWSFTGPFGAFDRAQLQRGFQVYKEVCAACHSMNLLSYRNLSQAGGPEFSVDQVKAIAGEYKVKDINDAGDAIERAAMPKDFFVAPFPNVKAAAAANNGKAPPDLSVIAKARTSYRGFPLWLFDAVTAAGINTGPDYINAFLLGFQDPPSDFELPAGSNYNLYYPGYTVAMPNILSDGLVTYQDGSAQTAVQYAKDVSAFLYWTAEPAMEERKRLGFGVMLFLSVFAGLLYFTKKRVWSQVVH